MRRRKYVKKSFSFFPLFDKIGPLGFFFVQYTFHYFKKSQLTVAEGVKVQS